MIGATMREPAEAGGDPGEIGESPYESARRGEHIAEMQLDAPLLVRLAGRERNAIDMLVDAHQREAQIRLARIALGVAADEAPPDPVAQQRAGARVQNAAQTMKPGTA